MSIRPATEDDLPAITAIFNNAIENSLAVWTETPVSLDDRREWLSRRLADNYPVLVVQEAGVIAGYASYGAFRAFDGYRFTGEISIYLAEAARGRGLGKRLLQALIEEAQQRGMHMLVAAIEKDNTASLHLHKALGFVETGRLPQIGRKFGQWLDLTLMQRPVQIEQACGRQEQPLADNPAG